MASDQIHSRKQSEVYKSGITARDGRLRGRIGVGYPQNRQGIGLMSSQQTALELYLWGMSVGVKDIMVALSRFAVGTMFRRAAGVLVVSKGV